MEDVVAVEVVLEDGSSRYFMTWGRIQDVVDTKPLEQLILKHSSRVSLRGVAKSARVCSTLSEAQSAPYFFEACCPSRGNRFHLTNDTTSGERNGRGTWKTARTSTTSVEVVRIRGLVMALADGLDPCSPPSSRYSRDAPGRSVNAPAGSLSWWASSPRCPGRGRARRR